MFSKTEFFNFTVYQNQSWEDKAPLEKKQINELSQRWRDKENGEVGAVFE